MKNLSNLKWIALFVAFAANAQQEKGIIGAINWLNNWTEFNPKKVEYNETNQICTEDYDNTTLLKKNTYLLQGPVYVTNGATLTIEAGTVIKGTQVQTVR